MTTSTFVTRRAAKTSAKCPPLASTLAAAVLIFAAAPAPVSAASFFDDFEAHALSPYWTQTGPGTIAFTTVAPYAGGQAVSFSNATAPPYFADLAHDYGSAQYGVLSVYAKTGDLSGSGAALSLENADGSPIAILERIADGTFMTRSNFQPGSETDHTFSSATPLDWHLFRITSSVGGVTFQFDGTDIFTDTSLIGGFRVADLSVWAAPSGSEFFDNFSATTSNVAPEPGSIVLLTTGFVGIVLSCRGQRRRLSGLR